MRWIVDLFERLKWREPPPPPVIDREALRDEMTRSDPAFARVRDVQHDARGLIGADRTARQLRDRWNERNRDAWRTDGAG